MSDKKLKYQNSSLLDGNPAEHLIELCGVVKHFENASNTFAVLRGVDLKIEPGEFVAVIGKSGSGKSTLLNIIAGIDRPTSGEVFVAGNRVNAMTEEMLARWRGENLGIVFQFFQMLPSITLLDNVMLPMELVASRKYKPKAQRARALQLLDWIGLADHAHQLPAFVSGGEQQRAAIARALANDPPLIVADEPTGNLDSESACMVFELFKQLVKEGKTLLMVTHDRELARAVPRQIEIKDGQFVRDGNLAAEHATEYA